MISWKMFSVLEKKEETKEGKYVDYWKTVNCFFEIQDFPRKNGFGNLDYVPLKDLILK